MHMVCFFNVNTEITPYQYDVTTLTKLHLQCVAYCLKALQSFTCWWSGVVDQIPACCPSSKRSTAQHHTRKRHLSLSNEYYVIKHMIHVDSFSSTNLLHGVTSHQLLFLLKMVNDLQYFAVIVSSGRSQLKVCSGNRCSLYHTEKIRPFKTSANSTDETQQPNQWWCFKLRLIL